MQDKRSAFFVNGRKLCLALFTLGLVSPLYGQLVAPANSIEVRDSLTLTGQVQSVEGTPVIAGLITVLRADSSVVKASVTDSAGRFVVKNLAVGQYVVRVTHVGLATAKQTISLPNSVSAVTPLVIRLEPEAIKLGEVFVKEKRPLFEILGDRIVLNIESNPVYGGGYAFDALSLAPRISVDPISKGVSIDGKTGLILYQNGRQLYLPSDQVVSYLQRLPTSSITRIEILTSPPARYDAGSSGVILLYTKGLDREGFNGEASISVGVGRYFKSNASLSASYRSTKLQASLLYAPSYRPTYFSWKSDQVLSVPGSSLTGFSRSDEFNRIDNTSQLLRTTVDWYVTNKLSVGAVVQVSPTAETVNPSSTILYRLATDSAPLTKIDALTQLKQQVTNVAGNLNLRREFARPGTSLSTDIDFARYSVNSLSSANFTQRLPLTLPPESVQIRYPNQVQIQTAKIDLTTPFYQKGQFEAGVKYSRILMDNQPVTESITSAFTRLEPLLRRAYQYEEQTLSAYENLSYRWTQWSFQGGLRVERTSYQGKSGTSVNINRHYTNLFPSVNVQYTTRDKFQYSVSANRRIVRPGFDQLNPAYIFYDPLTLYSGNPLLLPQLTTTLQATYSTPKRVSLSLVYIHSRNRIAEVVYRLDSMSATTLDNNINFNLEKRIAATLSLPFQLTPVWQVQATVTGANSQFYATFKNSPVLTARSTASVRLNNTLKGKIWSANVNITYRSTAVVGYMYYTPIWFMDLGVQRQFGERATIKLAATDIFHTLLITNYGDYLNTNITFRHRYESQRVFLTYTYRFGNTKAKSIKERNFGSATEQERLGKENRN